VRLGCNTVVFAGHGAREAVQWVAWAGYAGVEFAALPGTADHVSPDRRDEALALAEEARRLGLATPAIEAAGNVMDPAFRERLYRVFRLAAEMGVPVVTTGSAGSSTPESLEAFLPIAREIAAEAGRAGVVWACKPHVGAAVFDTATALRLVEAVPAPALRLNYDPTHLQRVGDDPVRAAEVLGPHLGHVHIRDYSSPDTRIGPPELQTAGRGLVDLAGVVAALARAGYDGFLDLEIIGATGWDPVRQMAIAAASHGYLSRLLRELAARPAGV
jgi:sugar phosphate isomerase/epimerase